MFPRTLCVPAGVILMACSALAFSPSIHPTAVKFPAIRAASSCGTSPCMGAVDSSDAEARRSRRAVVFGAGLLPALAVALGGGNAAVAQRPPPRPKVTSIPDECKQSGGCGMIGEDTGMASFRATGEAPEVLNTKEGKYSTGLKIQEISPGEGEEVGASSFVSLHYVLRRANGYFVDASYGFDRFETFDFKMGKGQVVQGFEKAVLGMKPAGRRRFVLPPELGYAAGVGREARA